MRTQEGGVAQQLRGLNLGGLYSRNWCSGSDENIESIPHELKDLILHFIRGAFKPHASDQIDRKSLHLSLLK